MERDCITEFDTEIFETTNDFFVRNSNIVNTAHSAHLDSLEHNHTVQHPARLESQTTTELNELFGPAERGVCGVGYQLYFYHSSIQEVGHIIPPILFQCTRFYLEQLTPIQA